MFKNYLIWGWEALDDVRGASNGERGTWNARGIGGN